MKRRVKSHWYFITYMECPVCLRSRQSRERRFTRRPKDYRRRHSYEDDVSCAQHDVSGV